MKRFHEAVFVWKGLTFYLKRYRIEIRKKKLVLTGTNWKTRSCGLRVFRYVKHSRLIVIYDVRQAICKDSNQQPLPQQHIKTKKIVSTGTPPFCCQIGVNDNMIIIQYFSISGNIIRAINILIKMKKCEQPQKVVLRKKARMEFWEISMRTWCSPMNAASQGAFVDISSIIRKGAAPERWFSVHATASFLWKFYSIRLS